MEDLADNPLVPALLAKIHTGSDETLMKVALPPQSFMCLGLTDRAQYKSVAKYQHKLVPYLQELTEQQIAKGLIKYVSLSLAQNLPSLIAMQARRHREYRELPRTSQCRRCLERLRRSLKSEGEGVV